MKNLFLILVLAIFAVSACKSDDAATKEDPEQPTPAADEPAKVEEPSEPEEPEASADAGAAEAPAVEEGTFGGMVQGATTVVVTQKNPDGEADFGGEPREADAEWIAKFVKAIGPNAVGSEAVPKCLPNYTLVFNGPEGKVAQFGAICGGTETVFLVRSGSSYSAEDNEAALMLIRGLAK